MGEMRDSDWSRENLLRSDWSGPSVATITTNIQSGAGTAEASTMTSYIICSGLF